MLGRSRHARAASEDTLARRSRRVENLIQLADPANCSRRVAVATPLADDPRFTKSHDEELVEVNPSLSIRAGLRAGSFCRVRADFSIALRRFEQTSLQVSEFEKTIDSRARTVARPALWSY